VRTGRLKAAPTYDGPPEGGPYTSSVSISGRMAAL